MMGMGAALRTVLAGSVLALASTVAWPAPPQWAAPPPAWPHVTLLDHESRSVPLDQLAGTRTIVLSFFFTTCSTICPPQTALLRQAHDLPAFRTGTAPLIVSIALNPLGDTPAAIRRYAAQFDVELGLAQGWVMLTSRNDIPPSLWRSFGVDGAAPENHAAVIWVGKPSTGRWTRIASTASAQDLADLLPEVDR